MKERPILFSGEMVKAILEDRKTMTRRIMKVQPPNDGEEYTLNRSFAAYGKKTKGLFPPPYEFNWAKREDERMLANTPYFSCPYGTVGDRLWVRETWGDLDYYQGNVAIHVLKDSNGVEHDIVYSAECQGYFEWTDEVGFPEYRKDGTEASRWRPSIFMPRWASRILLEVTDVKVERLQEITEEDAKKEGMPDEYPIAPVYCPNCQGQGTCGAVHPVSLGYMEIDCPECDTAKKRFKNLWDSINGKGRKPDKTWQDNPWVWVVEFRRVENV